MPGSNPSWGKAGGHVTLHTDPQRPHVHLTVEAEGLDRYRFDPRREYLIRFREAFAEALRSRGVDPRDTPARDYHQSVNEHHVKQGVTVIDNWRAEQRWVLEHPRKLQIVPNDDSIECNLEAEG